MLKTVKDYRSKYPWFFDREAAMERRIEHLKKAGADAVKQPGFLWWLLVDMLENCETALLRVHDIDYQIYRGMLIVHNVNHRTGALMWTAFFPRKHRGRLIRNELSSGLTSYSIPEIKTKIEKEVA